MAPEQLIFSFTASDSASLTTLAIDVEAALALTRKTPGWNGRTAPPQFVDLGGGCELVAVPAYLWRPRRVGPVHLQPCKLATLPRAS